MSTGAFADWSFTGTWHRYQQLALEAFERDRANGSHQTLIVAPPGAGKTLIGLEVIRRLDAPALVLCPTQTRAQATGKDPSDVLDDAHSWTGAAATRRDQELTRIVARLKLRLPAAVCAS